MGKKDPLVGSRIREYEILDVIGKGGMGAVYRARHIYLEEERAIKVIHSNLADDQRFIDRFIREAKILTKLNHPNLVKIHEFGTLDNNEFFMVLELLRGESAFHRVKRITKLAIRDALPIVRDAALGLYSAHQQRVIHRDVSPDNLFLARTESGQEITKVIDFGIARPHLEADQPLTQTDTFLGKTEYASPEQCGMLQEGEKIDHRTDIYSLGITLYFMLAGRLPFYSSTAQGYIFKHITEQPKPVSEYIEAADFPQQLDDALMKALSKKREDRHADMQEFAKQLDEILSAMGPELEVVTIQQGMTTARLEFHPGEIFAGRYLIEAKLGEGGMGVVYRAVDRMLDVRVALKVMGGHIIHDQHTVERLKREVILARKVSHSNACRIYDMGEYGNTHYVSMEYLEGFTLSDLIQKQGRLKLVPGIEIMKQVLAALHEAHRVGVIHRDLKPQNIMVDAENRSWIMDFGISTSSDVNKLTATGMLVGTPYYMAPEQLEGKEIDSRADLYACGIIMFQMFSGRLPFDAKSPIGVIAAHIRAEFPRVSSVVPRFLPELDDIIAKALEKDANARFQSAQELMKALESIDSNKLEEAESTVSISPTAETRGIPLPSQIRTRLPETSPQIPIQVAKPQPVTSYKWLGAGLAAVLAATIIWFVMREPVPDKPLSVIVPVPVVINALPWARTKITPVSDQIKISIPSEEQLTPCSFLLPEGEYSLELSNDSSSPALTKRIVVKAGDSNSFQFTMPDYDPGRISEELLNIE
jgi:serine/threonine protein kinase